MFSKDRKIRTIHKMRRGIRSYQSSYIECPQAGALHIDIYKNLEQSKE
jgi:predicted secreted protein